MTAEINRKLSPEDELYKRLTGDVPTKAGTAYERIATAVAGIIVGSRDCCHDIKAEGTSGVKHQLDGVMDGKTILEAKDHSIAKEKVGLNEVQNHQGAMIDLDGIERGFFASSTDYTSEARKYGNATVSNPRMIPTDLAIIRHSTKDDEKNRIKSFAIEIHMPYLDFDRGVYSLMLADKEELARFNRIMAERNMRSLKIGEFYDEKGNFVKQMMDLGYEQLPDGWHDKEGINGRFEIDSYIKAGGELLHIKGIDYQIPVKVVTEKFDVKMEGEACVLVDCPSLGINKLISDKDLKKALDSLK